jgi:glycosyltransferase involved in cell wall biosynthesis
MVKFIYSKSKIIFIQSRAFKKSILPLGFSNGKKISYLPNWAEDDFNNDSKFIDDPFAKLIPRDKFIIMFAGNLGVAQSLSTIINAAIEVKNSNIHWVFLGDGRQKNWLDNVVADARLQSSISILGRYPLEDMPRFFKLADVMLVTLKTDKAFSMTVPGKIQSYLRNAKPILSALDGEGAAVIKESGAGLNVNTEDSAGLAKAAHAMSKLSQKELDKMGINASAYYNKNFDVDVLLTQFENEVNLKCF